MKKTTLYITLICLFMQFITLNTYADNLVNKVFAKDIDSGGKYDVIVVGGGPEGVAAAISSARTGLKTLLVVEHSYLGGLFTAGKLNVIDLPTERGTGKILVKGIFGEFYRRVGSASFDTESAKLIFYDMVSREPNITVLYNTSVTAVIKKGRTVKSVITLHNGISKQYDADILIDATQDGDVAALTDCDFTYGMEDIGTKGSPMAVTLVFEMSNVNIERVKNAVRRESYSLINEGKQSYAGVSNRTVWGFMKLSKGYKPENPNAQLRGLNIGFQNNGNVLINALMLKNVNVLDKKERTRAMVELKKELNKVVPYIQKNYPGFENSKLFGVAEELYIRESRHFECEYMLNINDILENRSFEDKVAVTNYSVDIHANEVYPYGAIVGYPKSYTIPLRCMILKKADNLMIVGRSAGYTSLAAGSARVVPTGMAMGEAAGAVAKVAHDIGTTPSKVSKDMKLVKEVQNILRKYGCNLNHKKYDEPVESSPVYYAVKTIRSMGSLATSYNNDYKLSVKADKNFLINNVYKINNLTGFKNVNFEFGDKLKVQDVVMYISKNVAANSDLSEPTDYNGAFKILADEKILSAHLVNRFLNLDKAPENADIIEITARYYAYAVSLKGNNYPAIYVFDLK